MRIELNGYNPLSAILNYAVTYNGKHADILKNTLIELYKAGIHLETAEERIKVLELLSETLKEHVLNVK